MTKEQTKIKHIFIADDDTDDCSFFEDALKELGIETQLTVANDGVGLMTILEAITEPPPPDIIFLDLNMPRKNGFECLREIRNTPKLKNVPVVIFSTSVNPNAIETTYQLGANCYLRKPIGHLRLIKAIETVLTLELWHKNQLPKEKYVLEI